MAQPKTMTRAEFEARKKGIAPVQPVQKVGGVKVMSRADFEARQSGGVKRMTRAEFEAKKAAPSGGFWRTVGNQLIKPVSSAANLLEDVGKSVAYPIANQIKPGNFKDFAQKTGIDFAGHQKDVWTGKNQRTFKDIAYDAADSPNVVQNVPLSTMIRTTGWGGDFLLDPLNKVKLLALTLKGRQAEKVGGLGVSMAEQANKGERALLQIGNKNILPSVGNKVLQGATKANDAIRATETGAKAIDALSKISTKVRPAGISREEFKVVDDAARTFKKATQYSTDTAIRNAADIETILREAKATPAMRSALLHAVEKGDSSALPRELEQAFALATKVKNENEQIWTQAGGATLEGYGLPHLATEEIVERTAKPGEGTAKIFSPKTGQDIHREWVKVDGKITNLKDAGIKYDEKAKLYVQRVGQATANGGFRNKWEPVNVTQASAKEINDALIAAGKKPIFKEDLPSAVAVGGISAGRKKAGQNFLKATANVKSDKGLEMVNEVYNQLSNDQTVMKLLKGYDKVLGLWKAQVLVAPSYHVRNEVGNLWNNYLANTSPVDYISAVKLQKGIATGKLDEASAKLVEEMRQQGVVGGSQYGRDITQTISDEIGGASWNPLSQRFGLYRGNRAVGTAFEDNARMAHYLAKRREGFTPVEAGKSVDKFLFDYSDLTFIEQNVLKRVIPFYTWMRKNIPLQIAEFVKNPGKFAKAAITQKNIESEISKPNEKYMSDYLKKNSPMRIRDNGDGSTEYLLLGQWIPAAQAIQFLSQPQDEILRGITPLVTIPSDLINNKSFFKDTLGGSEPIERTPGELGSFLGFDMRKKLINVLRGIRVLNEIDKLNPGNVFGAPGEPSVFQGLTDNASETRGMQHSPDSTQMSRLIGFLLGKTSTYNPENSKTFYDYDTQERMNLYTQQLNNALKLGQTDLATEIIKEMEQFNAEREGKPNKNIEGYNLMGERYFQDMAANKQAETNREMVRKQMREKIREALNKNDREALQEALRLDPTYAKQAVKDALSEKSEETRTPDEQKLFYELEQMKTKARLNPFYSQ